MNQRETSRSPKPTRWKPLLLLLPSSHSVVDLTSPTGWTPAGSRDRLSLKPHSNFEIHVELSHESKRSRRFSSVSSLRSGAQRLKNSRKVKLTSTDKQFQSEFTHVDRILYLYLMISSAYCFMVMQKDTVKVQSCSFDLSVEDHRPEAMALNFHSWQH